MDEPSGSKVQTYISEIEISKGVSDLETCMEYLQFLEEVVKIKIRTEKPV